MSRRMTILGAAAIGALLIVTVGGYHFWRQPPASAMEEDKSGRRILYWYDPMVPQQHFKQPGKSPFMDMQLLPKYADEAQADGVAISNTVIQNLGIRLAPARKSAFANALSAVGRIAVDEHQLYSVQTREPGFIERLYVRAVGDPVKKGQKIADVYSPQLFAAAQELLALYKIGDVPDIEKLRAAARQRLQLLGMQPTEIDRLVRSGSADARIGIYAPASGVVQELGVREGAQTIPGTTLMQIADLSTVWLVMDVPERQAGRIRTGENVEAQVESFAGERFQGRVSYVYPDLDIQARTLRVRLDLVNSESKLRPGMYASVMINSSPHEALSVPTEAVIATGTRKVVIVKERSTFRPAEVTTGIERDGHTEVLQGLREGEEVVASGQFLIDSEASLNGVLARLAAGGAQ
jgi:membrane fusion protein, copper/silver efflux system